MHRNRVALGRTTANYAFNSAKCTFKRTKTIRRANTQIAIAARNGARFAQLWSGNISAHPSYSEADLALCNMLAFYTAKDEIAMDRLFRTSGLYTAEGRAKKWNERHGEITI